MSSSVEAQASEQAKARKVELLHILAKTKPLKQKMSKALSSLNEVTGQVETEIDWAWAVDTWEFKGAREGRGWRDSAALVTQKASASVRWRLYHDLE